jgi:hypothetical protein
MKVVKPVHDFDFESEDGTLQYKLVQGNFASQIKDLKNKGGAGGSFSWLPAPEVRKLIVDSPDMHFHSGWFRTGTGADYVNLGQNVVLYLSPQNRIMHSEESRYEINFGSKTMMELAKKAGDGKSGVLAVDLSALVKNKSLVKNDFNNDQGYVVISTMDYARQMRDDPDINALVSVCYSPIGEGLERMMRDIRMSSKETKAFVRMPEYVAGNAQEGAGIGRILTLCHLINDSSAYADERSTDHYAFAFGVRQGPMKASALIE